MVQIRKLDNGFTGSDGFYAKLRIPRKGEHASVTRPPAPRRQRFERKLKDFPPPTPQPTPCRLWQGPLDHYGYGAMKLVLPNGVRKSMKVHRWVMEEAEGRFLRPEETILHLCDNPPCFRIDHLRIGTIAENNADMRAKGRGVAPPVNRLFGDANPNTKITPAQREEVFEKWQAGSSTRTLAAEYGVSQQRIHAIVKMIRQKRSEPSGASASGSERTPPVKEEP